MEAIQTVQSDDAALLSYAQSAAGNNRALANGANGPCAHSVPTEAGNQVADDRDILPCAVT